MKRKRAVVVGFDYYAKFLADLMNRETADWRLKAFDSTRVGTVRAVLALRQADALISFGGPGPNTALVEAARRHNIPVFVIWAGSDVLKAQDDPFALEVIKQEDFINISDGPWLVEELRALGISAQYVPVTAVPAGGTVKAFPNVFRVLTYLPEPRRDFYGAPLIYDVARAMPDVPFTVVGNGGKDERAPANVHFAGSVSDMEDRIDRSTVVLRQPQHDGKSMLVLEALVRARHVVWNYDFPTVHHANGFDEVVATLSHLKELHARGALELNLEGRDFALQNFERSAIAARFSERLDEGRRQWQLRRPRSKRRVAISGLGLFCAEVAQYAKLYAPEWDTCLLRTGSRLDVLTSIVSLAGSDVWYSIGGPKTDRWLELAARLMRKPRVIHWVGSDIAWVAEDESLRKMLSGARITHLAEVNWTAEQLRDLGFAPRIAPLPPRHCTGAALPLPEKFTVMLYVPRTRTDFYGRREFERLGAVLRDQPIKYVVVGGGEISMPDGVDVDNLGWRDSLADIYQRVSVLVRLTPRDGLSLMVLEALSFGRHVLWTQDFPYTQKVGHFDDMRRAIENLLQAHLQGQLLPNGAAAQAISEQYSPHRCMRGIAATWDAALNGAHRQHLAMEAL